MGRGWEGLFYALKFAWCHATAEFVACPAERAVRLLLGVKQLKMGINLKQFVFETEVKAFLRICYYLHLYFQGILCNWTLVGFIDITDMVYYGTDFQNL